MSPGVRFLLSLFATLPAALVATMALHLAPPPGLPSLSQRPVWTTWALLGLWLLMAAALTWGARRAGHLWRLSFAVLTVLLIGTAAYGLWHKQQQQPTGIAMALALTSLALAATLIARAIKEQPQGRRLATKHPAAVAGSGSASADSNPKQQKPRESLWRRAFASVPRHGGFWIAGVLMLESFRWAHIVGVDPQRGVGMVGMLLTFFLALPAVSLSVWLPATAVVLLAAASLGFIALAWLSGLWPPIAAASLLIIVLARTCQDLGHRRHLAEGP